MVQTFLRHSVGYTHQKMERCCQDPTNYDARLPIRDSRDKGSTSEASNIINVSRDYSCAGEPEWHASRMWLREDGDFEGRKALRHHCSCGRLSHASHQRFSIRDEASLSSGSRGPLFCLFQKVFCWASAYKYERRGNCRQDTSSGSRSVVPESTVWLSKIGLDALWDDGIRLLIVRCKMYCVT